MVVMVKTVGMTNLLLLGLSVLLVLTHPVLGACRKGQFESGGGCAECPKECTECKSTFFCTSCQDGYGIKSDFSEQAHCRPNHIIKGIPNFVVYIVAFILIFFFVACVVGFIYAKQNYPNLKSDQPNKGENLEVSLTDGPDPFNDKKSTRKDKIELTPDFIPPSNSNNTETPIFPEPP